MRTLLLLILLGLICCDRAPAQTSPTAGANAALPDITTSRAFSRLSFHRPIYLTHAGDGSDRVFVVEQRGRILFFENRSDVDETSVFLDIREQVLSPPPGHNEEGLLALAFHPNYAENGYFYVYYSTREARSEPRHGILSRFSVKHDDANAADPYSEKVILDIEQPYGNHNGSAVLFGPDGYLYFSLGDGGWANDPLNSGQDLTTLLATILRIDIDNEENGKPYAIPADNPFVDRPEARGEIWAYGLRNIWRMSFDRETGDLWAGDIGQNKYEEIDLIVKGGNYGWNIREGFHSFKQREPAAPLLDPVVEYPRNKGISVTGGYVYRGARLPELEGVYLYADYANGNIWGLRYADGKVKAHRHLNEGARTIYIASFGEDEAGEVYICAFDNADGRGGPAGRIYKLNVK